jgi:hypothetical protein
LARRTVGYADELLRSGPSEIADIEGPMPNERITLKMRRVGPTPILIMHSDASTLAEAE